MSSVFLGILRMEWRYQVRQLAFPLAVIGFAGWAAADGDHREAGACETTQCGEELGPELAAGRERAVDVRRHDRERRESLLR